MTFRLTKEHIWENFTGTTPLLLDHSGNYCIGTKVHHASIVGTGCNMGLSDFKVWIELN